MVLAVNDGCRWNMNISACMTKYKRYRGGCVRFLDDLDPI